LENKDYISHKLFGIEKLNNFTVPQNYFENLPQEIQGRINFDWEEAKKKNPYLTPEHYFETLPQNIQQLINFKVEEKEKINPYLTPEHYFDSLVNTIQEKAVQKNSEGYRLGDFSFVPKPALVFITACLLFLMVFKYNIQDTDRPVNFAQFSSEEIKQNIEKNIDEVDDETIVELLAENELKPGHMEGNKTKNATEEYLMENVDENAIIEEL
jgi:hypothetical protein